MLIFNVNIAYCHKTTRLNSSTTRINKNKNTNKPQTKTKSATRANKPVSKDSEFSFHTKKPVICKNDKFYFKTKQLEYKRNKVICKGESVFWMDNLQVSGEKIEIQMEGDSVKTITVTDKALIVLFNDLKFPNHMTARKIIFNFQNKDKKMEIKNITLYGNVDILYAILQNNKINMIGKGHYNELQLYINPTTKQWDAKIDIPAGNLMSPEYAKNNWEKIKLKNFKIFKK